jgi:hypothetical protein
VVIGQLRSFLTLLPHLEATLFDDNDADVFFSTDSGVSDSQGLEVRKVLANKPYFRGLVLSGPSFMSEAKSWFGATAAKLYTRLNRHRNKGIEVQAYRLYQGMKLVDAYVNSTGRDYDGVLRWRTDLSSSKRISLALHMPRTDGEASYLSNNYFLFLAGRRFPHADFPTPIPSFTAPDYMFGFTTRVMRAFVRGFPKLMVQFGQRKDIQGTRAKIAIEPMVFYLQNLAYRSSGGFDAVSLISDPKLGIVRQPGRGKTSLVKVDLCEASIRSCRATATSELPCKLSFRCHFTDGRKDLYFINPLAEPETRARLASVWAVDTT